MAKLKIKDLDYETQLDVLSRIYLTECAKNPNHYVSGALKGNYRETYQTYMGKVKNMFLCGQINEYGYARGDGDYELNRLSIPGALFNYMFRDRLIKNINKDKYASDDAIKAAYAYVTARGYKPFYTYMKYAYLPQGPTSIEDRVASYGSVIRPEGALILKQEVSPASIGLDRFSFQDIAVIKNHIKATMREYVRQRGMDESVLGDIFDSVIDNLPTTPAKVKKTERVERPSKSFFETYKDKAKTVVSLGQAPHNSAAKAATEAFDLIEAIDEEEESLILTFTNPKDKTSVAYDKYGTLLAWDQNGCVRNPDGTIFEGDTVYDEDPMLNPNAAYTKDGLRYNGEYEDSEEEEEYIIPGSRGIARDDAGRLINTANGASSDELRELIEAGFEIVEDDEEVVVKTTTTDTPQEKAPTPKKSKTNPDQLTLFDFVDTQNQEQ